MFTKTYLFITIDRQSSLGITYCFACSTMSCLIIGLSMERMICAKGSKSTVCMRKEHNMIRKDTERDTTQICKHTVRFAVAADTVEPSVMARRRREEASTKFTILSYTFVEEHKLCMLCEQRY